MDFYDPSVRGRRDALKPLVTTQPDGANFTITDHEISWDRWRFRYSLHPREGLVLHQIAWEEAPGKRRSILYRASVSDLLVPSVGVQSLRYALLISTLFNIWSAVHYMLAARTLRADLATAEAVDQK